jgi:hypothetical protein
VQVTQTVEFPQHGHGMAGWSQVTHSSGLTQGRGRRGGSETVGCGAVGAAVDEGVVKVGAGTMGAVGAAVGGVGVEARCVRASLGSKGDVGGSVGATL